MKNYKKIDKSYLDDAGHYIRHDCNKFIALHYTGCNGDTAEATAKYFKKIYKDGTRSASAHFIVDAKSCFQSVSLKFSAWHCGDAKNKWTKGGSLYGICTNYNSIGIEICNSLNKFDNKALENAIALTKDLMKKYNIPIKNVVRHYDVSGKLCPQRATDENEKYKNNWKYIKAAINTGDKYYIKIENDIIYKRLRKAGSKWVTIGKLSY